MFEGISSFNNLLWTQSALAHFLDSQKPIAKLNIFSFIDRTEAALTYLARNMMPSRKLCNDEW